MDTAGPLPTAAQHIFGRHHLGTSLKLGTYPGWNQENGSEEGFCTIPNKNKWVKPNMRYTRGGDIEKAWSKSPAQPNLLQAVRRTDPCLSCYPKLTFVVKGSSGCS